jgi:3-methylcrotonyl-CoA carboxylase alpha subunit
MAAVTITRVADGMYCVEHDGRNQIVYVAGPMADRWVFWNGQVFRGDFRADEVQRAGSDRAAAGGQKTAGLYKARPTSLTAPMPARVSKILIQSGSVVKKGDTLVVLEAMKMELPVRSPADGKVAAVHCREGELVDADAVLIDLT